MSRSRHPQCSAGRGCRCCGDAGAVRRARERDAGLADAADIDSAIEDRNEPDDGYECDASHCPICSPSIDIDALPVGVTFTEAQ